jgi:chromosomal replication initiator protein
MKLASEISVRKEPISEELVLALLNKFGAGNDAPAPRLSPKLVLGRTAEHFHLKTSDLCGDRRLKTIALARQVAMYLLRKEVQLPLEACGRLLGGRDHSTVLHGQEKIASLLSTSEKLRLDIAAIRKSLYVDKV